MKKVGIMTMHRVVNYGSFLQAYGLKKTINSLGYNATFIDFHPGEDLTNNKKNLLTKIKNNLNIFNYIKKEKIRSEFKKRYNTEFLKLLEVAPERKYNDKIEKLVIGSDEVFNCIQPLPIGFSPDLFGKGFENIDVISYAGCFGHTDYELLKEKGKDKEVANYLKKFKNISVRDLNSYKTVKKLTGIASNLNLDPVLISNFDEEVIDYNDLSNYIIIYAYVGRLSKTEEKYIKKFAKKYNKKIISVGFYQKIADLNLVVNPFEMLGIFKNADYVITDTFHGTIFSVKMNTKFCTIIRDSNKNKLGYLLDVLNLKERTAHSLEDIEKLYSKEINFNNTNKIIKKETEKSLNYLKENLK